MRVFSWLLSSLLFSAQAVASGEGHKPPTQDIGVEFLLDGDQWQPGERYRSGSNWLALACGKSGCRFEPAKLTVRREKWQGHYDDQPTDGQKLVVRRQSQGAGTVLAWFKIDPAVPWLKAGPIDTYWAETFKKRRPATEGTLELAVDLPSGDQAVLVPLFDPQESKFFYSCVRTASANCWMSWDCVRIRYRRIT